MKSIVLSTLVLFLSFGSTHAQYSKVKEITLESEELGQTREIMVYAPFGFGDNA
jgi:hypothetical protein